MKLLTKLFNNAQDMDIFKDRLKEDLSAAILSNITDAMANIPQRLAPSECYFQR